MFRIMPTKKNPDQIILVNNPSDLPDPSSLDELKSLLLRLLSSQSLILLETLCLCV
ncbi:MAG: hypothetical protein CM15mP121_1260 [Bacteroidota bacterium]|nr:MAG: hypothetical protein CM15mP121_1260 [Bacteroidota bacterium]